MTWCVNDDFNIPQNEKIYLITGVMPFFGEFKIGIAICSTGLYVVTDEKERLYYSWEEFVETAVGYDGAHIRFDGKYVYLSTSSTVEEMLIFTSHLKDRLKEFYSQYK